MCLKTVMKEGEINRKGENLF